VFGGDAPGEIVDLLQRDLLPDEVRVELGELGRGVDACAGDLDLPDDEESLGRAGRRLDAGRRDHRAAWLRQRDGGALESLALPARLVAGRDNLCAGRYGLGNGSERDADHRQGRRDYA